MSLEAIRKEILSCAECGSGVCDAHYLLYAAPPAPFVRALVRVFPKGLEPHFFWDEMKAMQGQVHIFREAGGGSYCDIRLGRFWAASALIINPTRDQIAEEAAKLGAPEPLPQEGRPHAP